jgi:hypothetical protein
MTREQLVVFLAASVLAACVVAGTARADRDPASDYLLGEKVFFPFDAKIPAAKERQLKALVDGANRVGFRIRVAVIASSYDRGAITSLWRRPRTYARFLGAELQYVYKGRLLIVMPNGFGISRRGHTVAREYRALESIPIGTGAPALVDSASAAVQRLATQAGVAIPAGGTSHGRMSTTWIALLAVAGVALLVLLRFVLRRR